MRARAPLKVLKVSPAPAHGPGGQDAREERRGACCPAPRAAEEDSEACACGHVAGDALNGNRAWPPFVLGFVVAQPDCEGVVTASVNNIRDPHAVFVLAPTQHGAVREEEPSVQPERAEIELLDVAHRVDLPVVSKGSNACERELNAGGGLVREKPPKRVDEPVDPQYGNRLLAWEGVAANMCGMVAPGRDERSAGGVGTVLDRVEAAHVPLEESAHVFCGEQGREQVAAEAEREEGAHFTGVAFCGAALNSPCCCNSNSAR